MNYLASHVDPGLSIPDDTSAESLAAGEIERLQRQLAVVSAVLAWPRRLGGDASSEDLARDKKLARRVAHVLAQSLNAWMNGKPDSLPSDESIRQEAAVLDWPSWFEEQLSYLTQRVSLIATWALTNGGDPQWGKRAVVKLSNEINWLQYAKR